MTLDQGGVAMIAWYLGKEDQYVPVAMKKRQRHKELLTDIRLHSNECVVELLETSATKNSLYLIYEYMDVSLRHIASVPKEPFEHCEIGAICREVYFHFDNTNSETNVVLDLERA